MNFPIVPRIGRAVSARFSRTSQISAGVFCGRRKCLAIFARPLLAAVLAPGCNVAAHAQVTFTPNWVDDSTAARPSGYFSVAMAYDPVHGQVVAFGGLTTSNDYVNETWVWNGSNWIQKSPSAQLPAPRAQANMVYDAALGKVVLFGGQGDAGNLGDTWVWDGSNWTNVTPSDPSKSPSPRYDSALAYDAAHGTAVLFGGVNSGLLADTWLFDGKNWSQANPAHPPGSRIAAAAAYDPLLGEVVLFGGFDAGSNYYNDTFTWNGTDWTLLDPATKPSGRSDFGMVYDEALGQIVLFGGTNNSQLNDTWIFNGTAWTEESTAASPPVNYEFGMTYDAGHAQVVMFGGGNDPSDTFLFGQGGFGSVAVGSTSAAQTLNFFVPSGTTVGSLGVLTQGAPGLDFLDAGGSTCTAQTYGSDTYCTVNVKFKPSVVGLRRGVVVLFSGSGNKGMQLARAPVDGVGTGPQIAYGPGVATALNTTVDSLPLGVSGGVSTDGAGDAFIADRSNNRVVEVPVGGGSPIAIDPTVNGIGLNGPEDMAVDGAGDLFIADTFNNRVVEVPAGGGAAIAIAPTAGGQGLSHPWGVVTDVSGNLFISDFVNGRVVEAPANGGPAIAISPVVDGASFDSPAGLAVDSAGDLFIADGGNARVVEILVGGGAPIAISPSVNGLGLGRAFGIAVDAAGDLFIADNPNSRIVEVPGDGSAPVAIDPTVNGEALSGTAGVAVDDAGDLFIGDENGRLLELARSQPPALSFPTATKVGSTDTPDGTQMVQIVNIGNRDLHFSALDYPADFSPASDANACSSSSSLSAGETCDVPVEFTPENSGSLSEHVTLTDNNLNKSGSNQLIPVTGTGSTEALVITWPTPAPIPYGTPLSATQLDASANVAGSFSYDPGAGTEFAAGPQILHAIFTPSDTKDYKVTPAQVTIQIEKATPVVSWSPAALLIDGKLSTAQLDATANAAGKFVYTPALGTQIKTATETLKVLFTPTDTQDYNSVTKTVSLPVGTISVSPTSINFGTVYLGSVTDRTITVTNEGSTAVSIHNPLISILTVGDSREFLADNLCPASLAAHKSCTMKIEYVAGPFYHQQSATLRVMDSSPGSPQNVSLTALTIDPEAKFSTTSLSFGTEKKGVTSAAKPVTLSNPGATALTIKSLAVSGADAADFKQTNHCGNSLAAGANCTISVSFKSGAKGARSAKLVLEDNAESSSLSVALSGTGN